MKRTLYIFLSAACPSAALPARAQRFSVGTNVTDWLALGTMNASASAAVRCESMFRNFTGAHSFAMYRISVTFRPPPAGMFTVVSPSQTITADFPPSKL